MGCTFGPIEGYSISISFAGAGKSISTPQDLFRGSGKVHEEWLHAHEFRQEARWPAAWRGDSDGSLAIKHCSESKSCSLFIPSDTPDAPRKLAVSTQSLASGTTGAGVQPLSQRKRLLRAPTLAELDSSESDVRGLAPDRATTRSHLSETHCPSHKVVEAVQQRFRGKELC